MPLRIAVNYGRDAALEPEALNEDRPMGGIRTATLALCAALARRGHDVHLFAVCPRPGLRDGIAFHDRAEFAGFGREQSVDALVAIPEVLPLLMPLRARARVVWSGNAFQAGDCRSCWFRPTASSPAASRFVASTMWSSRARTSTSEWATPLVPASDSLSCRPPISVPPLSHYAPPVERQSGNKLAGLPPLATTLSLPHSHCLSRTSPRLRYGCQDSTCRG